MQYSGEHTHLLIFSFVQVIVSGGQAQARLVHLERTVAVRGSPLDVPMRVPTAHSPPAGEALAHGTRRPAWIPAQQAGS